MYRVKSEKGKRDKIYKNDGDHNLKRQRASDIKREGIKYSIDKSAKRE
jgi:hypothetical protein